MEIRITSMCTKTEQKFVIDLYIGSRKLLQLTYSYSGEAVRWSIRLGSVISFFQGLNASRIVVGIERLRYPDVSPRLSDLDSLVEHFRFPISMYPAKQRVMMNIDNIESKEDQ